MDRRRSRRRRADADDRDARLHPRPPGLGHPQPRERPVVSYLQAKRIRKARRRKQRRSARRRVVLLAVLGLIGTMVILAGLALNHEIKKIARETAHLNIKTLGQNTAIYDRYGHLLGIVAGE